MYIKIPFHEINNEISKYSSIECNIDIDEYEFARILQPTSNGTYDKINYEISIEWVYNDWCIISPKLTIPLNIYAPELKIKAIDLPLKWKPIEYREPSLALPVSPGEIKRHFNYEKNKENENLIENKSNTIDKNWLPVKGKTKSGFFKKLKRYIQNKGKSTSTSDTSKEVTTTKIKTHPSNFQLMNLYFL